MRIYSYVVICILLVIISYRNVFAQSDDKKILEAYTENLEEKESQRSELKNVMDELLDNMDAEDQTISENTMNMDVANYSIDDAFEVYSLPANLITQYDKQGSLYNVIGTQKYTFVPIQNRTGEMGYASLKEKDQGFEVIYYRFGSKDMVENKDIIERKINDFTGSKTSYIYLRCEYYYMTLVFFTVESTEYVIPYCSLSYDIGIKSGDIIKVETLFSLLKNTYDESIGNEGEMGGMAVMSDHNTDKLPWLNYGIGIGVVLLLIIIVIIIKIKDIGDTSGTK